METPHIVAFGVCYAMLAGNFYVYVQCIWMHMEILDLASFYCIS